MKKTLTILLAILLSLVGYSQVSDYTVEAWDFLIAPGAMIINGDTIYATTQTTLVDTVLATKLYVDGKAAGLDSITDIDSDYFAKIYLNGAVVDSFLVDSTYHSIYSDSSKFADNSTYSDTATIALNTVDQISYTITLPANATSLAASALACTDKPDDWILTAVGENLYIEHNLGKYYSNIVIKSNLSGDIYNLLRPFYGAYQNVQDTDNNNIIIEGISEDYKTTKLQIKLSF